MNRTHAFDAMVWIKDFSREGSRFLNLYSKKGLLPILTLFDKARADGRLLRFLTTGPEALACAEAIKGYIEGPPVSPFEGAVGLEHWVEASWRGVRREVALRERNVSLDPTPILRALANGGGITLDSSSVYAGGHRIAAAKPAFPVDLQGEVNRQMRKWGYV